MPAVNQVLQQGRYRIILQIGQDSSGAVYEAYDNERQANVVLKEIPFNLKKITTVGEHESLKLAFNRDAKLLTEIRHDTLLQVLDYFSEISRQFLVMEWTDGNYLSELIERDKRAFSYSDAANWTDQLLDALSYLHTQTPAIIHRDIKPQNIKLTADGRIKLLAPNISQNTDAKENALYYVPLEQIWSGLDAASQKVILNSYNDKSEQILKQPADARSDVYALGATVYQLVTARRPIDALERSIDILDGKADPLPAPAEINPDIPAEISDVLMKALEIKRENRFDSASVMRQVLRTALIRVKERAAEETNKQEEAAMQELRLAEQNRLEEERQIAEQKRLEIEAEQKRLEDERVRLEQERLAIEAQKKQQAELLEQQLREAETQRLLAEQRAAEAEKLLREKEAKALSANAAMAPEIVVQPEAGNLSEEFILEIEPEINPPAASEGEPIALMADAPVELDEVLAFSEPEKRGEPDDFDDLFAQPQKDNSFLKRMAAVAAGLILFGGVGFGAWFFMTSNSAESSQAAPHQTISTTTTAATAPTIEASPAPSVEPTPENVQTQSAFTSPDSTAPTTAPPVVKNKPNAQPTPVQQAKKQPTPAPKNTPEKKPVTVDDLINDN